MASDKGENSEDYELYTEKVVLNPKATYKRVIKGLKIGAVFVVLAAFVAIFAFVIWPRIKAKIIADNVEIIYIEKDDYEDYVDDQYSEDDMDIEDDYETAFYNLRLMVDSCLSSVVLIDYEDTDIVSELENSSSDKMPGVIVGYINSEYMVLTSSDVYTESEGNNGQLIAEFEDSSEVKLTHVNTQKDIGISIYKFSSSDISSDTQDTISVANLGNSYAAGQGDVMILAGKLYGITGAVNYCTITGISTKYCTDNGYEELETNLLKDAKDYGFLFNSSGNLVGISTISSDTTINAIGISDLKYIIESMINNHGILYCGITGQNVTDELATKYSLPAGIYISSVELNSPAYAAGLQAGDVIIEVDNESVLTIQEFNEKLYQKSAGDTITITVKRVGKDSYQKLYFDVTVKLVS